MAAVTELRKGKLGRKKGPTAYLRKPDPLKTYPPVQKGTS